MNAPFVSHPHTAASHLPGLRLPPDATFIESRRAAPPDVIVLPPPPAAHPVRTMSPRELSDLAYELYLSGSLSQDEYLLLGFPSELHPAYDRTIGALTGAPARPDAPRDLIREWEARLRDLRASDAPLPALVSRAARTLGLLRWLETPGLGKPGM